METEAPYFTWRRTSGAAPDAVKAARPVLNGGREETCRKVTRLAPTQRRGGGDQTGHLRIKRATGRPLRQGLRFQESARRALCASRAWAACSNKIKLLTGSIPTKQRPPVKVSSCVIVMSLGGISCAR